jgi:PiT family inorganic phosphate transporter
VTALLVVLAIGFAFSMSAHYTGACMGMPHALRAISARDALLVMAPLTLIGAAIASHGVEHTVGHDLLTGGGLSVPGLVIVLAGSSSRWWVTSTIATRGRWNRISARLACSATS